MDKKNIINNDYGSYEFMYSTELPEYRSVGIRLRHKSTGADIFHLFNDDRENLFSFSFKTPPYNDTGIAHIVEHSVLAGSKRFKIKEPFLAMLNRSMNTFLNAMTFPDKTVYPASSIVEKDFYNLMLVYGDAVFFPLLRKETFMHEAYHFKFNGDSDNETNVVGVVFNEMKGAYSDPDSIVERLSYSSLLRDTAYGFDSGGYPPAIPDLTYEEFVAFHRKYYHPSNCRIFLYGNLPTKRHLDFLEREFLSKFSKTDVNADLGEQARWEKPQRVERTYPLSKESDLKKKSTVLMNWLTVPTGEPEKLLAMEIVSEILIGNDGSPLRKRLVESKLGDDLSPVSGLESELREVIFSVGLRGTDREKTESIESLVMDTLTELKREGIDKDDLEAAVHRVEFRNREIRGGGAPYALKLMRKSLRGWLHGFGPEVTLKFNDYMVNLKKKLGKYFRFEDFLDEQFLSNKHRSTVVVYPDPEYRDRIKEEIEKKLESYQKKFSEEEKIELRKASEALEEFLQKPDDRSEIEKLPSLDLKDVPKKVEVIHIEELEPFASVRKIYHDIFTNGIVYLDIGFDITKLKDDLSFYLPIFGSIVTKAGLPGIGYDKVALKLAKYTGGFHSSLLAATLPDVLTSGADSEREYLFFRLKAIRGNFNDALKLVCDLILHADFNDRSRIKDIIVELRNDMKSSVIPSGHIFSMIRAKSWFSEALRKEEMWKGISQLFFLDTLVKNIDKEIDSIIDSLENLRKEILNRLDILNITIERQHLKSVIEGIDGNFGAIIREKANVENKIYMPPMKKIDKADSIEIFTTSTKVGYVAHAMRAAKIGTHEEPYQSVLAHLLRTSYLWESVRMKGGAYGAFALNNGTEGVFTFGSYRDPNINSTIKAYSEAFDFIEKEVGTELITNSIIGAVGREEHPLDPGEKGFLSLQRNIFDISDNLRQRRREIMLNTKYKDLKDVTERLREAFKSGRTAIINGREIVDKEARTNRSLLKNIVELP